MARSMRGALRSAFSGDVFVSAFARAGKGLTDVVRNFFSGSFFGRLSSEFRKAGESLTIKGFIGTAFFGTLTSLLAAR